MLSSFRLLLSLHDGLILLGKLLLHLVEACIFFKASYPISSNSKPQ
ncbi:hypothetical protein EGR_11229 [Echinococcus granulosus]|uniref:Uncharacterized protein n=1 Tax=Echinococcus granulosus TaxID=6210 RepID=W6UK73_ECHGR|nr:hypothetical protein EGR_11229 [Echinococcus granulosus]EUB53914.1 hypothetical protein EGR_11229 [Echinococcus granulosus]